jgi:hypothetical protein
VGDGVTPGAVEVGGGGGGVAGNQAVYTTSSVTFATLNVTTATFNEIHMGGAPSTIYTGNLIANGSPLFLNSDYANVQIVSDEQDVEISAPLGLVIIDTTTTIETMSIGLNNGARAITNVAVDADNILLNPGQGGSIYIGTKLNSGVEKNLAFRRDGSIFFNEGQSIGSAVTLGDGSNSLVLNAAAGANVYLNSGDGDTGVEVRADGVYLFTNLNDTPNELSFGSTGTLTVGGHIVPGADVSYDLGSPTQQFRHLYVSSSTVYIAGNALTVDTNNNLTINGSQVGGLSGVYTRSTLPAGAIGLIITVSDSGSDTNSPAGNYAPAYWDDDAELWTYIGNSNSVTVI